LVYDGSFDAHAPRPWPRRYGYGRAMQHECKYLTSPMVFTWSAKDLCIIFRWWRITGPFSFLFSLAAIVLLTAGYEGVRQATRRYEAAHARRLNSFTSSVATGDEEIADPTIAGAPTEPIPDAHDDDSPLLVGRDNRAAVARQGKFAMAFLYAVQVFYSFFIMLLFMTYNGFVMFAVAFGAFLGYVVFADGTPATKTIACH
ncbi:hypothetical protein NUU61_000689, partial [Penicillium alfredii]